MTRAAVATVAVPCAVCGGTGHRRLYEGRWRTGTVLGDVAVVVGQCVDCGFVYNSPRPDAEAYGRYYADTSMASGQVFRDTGPDSHYSRLFRERAAFLSPFLSRRGGGALVDVGCGRGGFLAALGAPAGWSLRGVEPSAKAAAAARKAGLDVVEGIVGPAVGGGAASVDVLSLVSVLEHLWAPAEELAAMAAVLKPDGLLFVEVPNTLHPELSLDGFFTFEHVSHFTPHSLWALLRRLGFGAVVFDASPSQPVFLRCVATRDPAPWGMAAVDAPADDGQQVATVIAAYAVDEARLRTTLDRRLRAVIARWQGEGRRIAIYGAGQHTTHLAGLYDLKTFASVLLDSDPEKRGTTVLGLPVYGPQDIDPLGIEAVLVSSQRFTDEIAATVRRHTTRPVDIETCYG